MIKFVTLTQCAILFAAIMAQVGADRYESSNYSIRRHQDRTLDATVLFSSSEPLDLILETDLRTVIRDIGDDRQQHPAVLTVVGLAGDTQRVDVAVRTRGNFRRKRSTCNFPPIRFYFDSSQVRRTIFAAQTRLKLVTHCQKTRDDYEQYVLQEYLIYKTYNTLTDMSHRVRLARITYIDTSGREDTATKYGFLIETDDQLAARSGARYVEQIGIHPYDMDDEHIRIVNVLQYMIGNTDWSVPGLHNIIVLEKDELPYPVAYDFDWAGVISARYAKPDGRLPIRTVRERLYRGFCRPESSLRETFQLFELRRDSIYALYRNQEGLSERNLDRTLEYYDEFYETISDGQKIQWEFLDTCRRD